MPPRCQAAFRPLRYLDALNQLPPRPHELPIDTIAILEISHSKVPLLQGNKMSTTPYADSRLAKYIDRQINQLYHKTQAEIARDVGFRKANFITC